MEITQDTYEYTILGFYLREAVVNDFNCPSIPMSVTQTKYNKTHSMSLNNKSTATSGSWET